MSLFDKKPLTWLQSLSVKLLQAGSIPNHIAIIMDGNRRFAKRERKETKHGHSQGSDRLKEAIYWCEDIGIRYLTVYAFSTENFNRTKKEVEGLMDLLENKIQLLLDDGEDLKKRGLRIRIFGNYKLFPSKLQKMMAELVLLTENSEKSYLNICLAYTGREEICNAVDEVRDGVNLGLIEPDDIDEKVFEKCLYSYQVPELDLMIRTSGEVRLSDFLLWQSSYSVLVFEETVWPDFTFWHLCQAVLYFQINCKCPQAYKQLAREENNFLEDQNDRRRALEEIGSNSGLGRFGKPSSNEDNENFKMPKEKRISRFIEYVQYKKYTQLKESLAD